MRKIVALEFVSLDGVMQAPGAPQEDTEGGFTLGGWTFPLSDAQLGSVMQGQMAATRAVLLGRKTYQIFAGYWPAHDAIWPGINAATKYVVSETLTQSGWGGTVFIKGDIAAEIRKLKQQDGPDLQVWGSSQLLQTLLQHGLVDTLSLKIFPVVLGRGKRLFGTGSMPAAYTLTHSETTPSGVIVANYARAGEVQTGSFGG